MEKEFKPIKELEEYLYTQKGGIHRVDCQITVREFVNSWFYEDYKLIVGPDTFRGCCFDMDHILAVFGDKIISDINIKDICIFYKSFERGGYSQSTISNIHKLFSELLYAAFKKELIKFV